VSKAFYEDIGYNDYAESNDLIILYPQTTTNPWNTNGCWDWTGEFSSFEGDPLMDTKDGLQVSTLLLILQSSLLLLLILIKVISAADP